MNYFRQIFYEMKHQKMMTWVSVSGTALSIFLVMALFMTDNVKTVEVSPESNRTRVLRGENIHIQGSRYGDSSGMGIGYEICKKLYSGLDGIENVSYVNSFLGKYNVNVKGQESTAMNGIQADAEYWKIFDFRFIDGRPIDAADADAEAKKVVLSQSVARRLYGEDKVVGREVDINCIPYEICGVVEDVNPLLRNTYADIYLPYKPKMGDDVYFGQTSVLLLMKEGIDASQVKEQVEARYKMLASEVEKEGDIPVYHLQPYTSEEIALGGYGSNNSPQLEKSRRMQWIFYAVLILLPAINISSMTRSRLRHRVTEIGVRRAFGAKRISIVGQIFGENLIITFIGGIIGMVFSIVFVLLASHLFFSNGSMFSSTLEIVNARPTLGMLFQWSNFLFALLLCFVLNVLSATVPAWRASMTEPAVAISKSR